MLGCSVDFLHIPFLLTLKAPQPSRLNTPFERAYVLGTILSVRGLGVLNTGTDYYGVIGSTLENGVCGPLSGTPSEATLAATWRVKAIMMYSGSGINDQLDIPRTTLLQEPISG